MKIETSNALNSTYMTSSSGDSSERKSSGEGRPVEAASAGGSTFPGERQLIDAIEKANHDLKISNTSLKFSIHEQTKQILVKIVDNESKEVVREIPPEKILDMVAAMLERTGLFVDKKA